MHILGINDSSHDASVSVIKNGKILFAAHAERYSKIKNDFSLNKQILDDALEFGVPDKIAYFEKRNKKRLRMFLHGGKNGKYAANLYKNKIFGKELQGIKEIQVSHHRSHASAGFLTSPFNEAVTVVIDAIGEFETASIWSCQNGKIKKIWSLRYPTSFGLFYSFITDYVGLEPGRDEYILMAMAAYGDKTKYEGNLDAFFPAHNVQTMSFHKKLLSERSIRDENDIFDIAAAAQAVFEKRLGEIMNFAQRLTKSKNLVYMGGCALNCAANPILYNIFEKVWIMPNPGDSGSSLGAALSVYAKHVEWRGPYLGKNIGGHYPVEKVIKELINTGVVGVMNGRAEFGPRALGNRSLLADPRSVASRDNVNLIKMREKFRPFAPVVLEEDANEWFDLPAMSPYMQLAVRAKKPNLIPGAVHVDGTSRVQTVSKDQHPGLHAVLTKWKNLTGIPVLINTSLNIKNQPLLNDMEDAECWKTNNPNIPLIIGS
jgi:carbamoyltransferase